MSAKQVREPKDPAFSAAWQKRLKTPLPPLHPSTLHRHDPDCWGEPYDDIILGVRLKLRRCQRSGAIEEVR